MAKTRLYQAPPCTIQRSPPRPVIVPYWIRSLFLMNKLHIQDVKNVDRLIEFLPRDVLIEFLAVNSFLPIGVNTNITFLEKAIFDTIGDTVTYREILGAREHVLSSLTASMNSLSSDDAYTIEDVDEEVFVIYVEQGFINHLKLRDRALRFVSDCLETQYRYASPEQVVGTSLYEAYLNLLNEKAPF